MTAEPHGPVPVLPPDTTPAAIRDALVDDERASLETAYRQAMTEAIRSLDLNDVLDVLRRYHRIAEITRRHGPEAHRRMLAKAAEITRTGRNPDGVPVEDVREMLRKRLGE